MQFLTQKRSLALTLICGISLTTLTPSASAMVHSELQSSFTFDAKKIIGWAVIGTVLAAVIHYKVKKTNPKPITAQDDSLLEQLRVFWLNTIVGQEAKGERAARVEIDPENPNCYVFKYEKIEPYGLIGTTDFYAQKIIPGLILLTTILKIKDQLHDGHSELSDFATNPIKWMSKLLTHSNNQ